MLASLQKWTEKHFISDEISAFVDRIPKPVGRFGYDPWGYKDEGLKFWMSVFKPLFEHYFRVDCVGLENIPKHGRVLVVANHGGQLPIDGGLIGYAMATNQYAPRAARVMVERWVPTLPFIGNSLCRAGAAIGDPMNCIKMLRNEEAVIVFPEGVKGIGKPYSKAYQLQRFGTGFMHIALQEKVPILPVGVVGCEEAIPSLGNLESLASLLKVPHIPLAVMFPLPSKVILSFGKPINIEGGDGSEQEVNAYVDQVKVAIDALIRSGREKRKGWFW